VDPAVRGSRRAPGLAPRSIRAALAFAVAHAGCSGGGAPAEPAEPLPAAEVTCQAIAPGLVDDIVELSGVIAPPPRLDAVLSSPIAGRIAQVAVEEGDRVAADAVLATVEDPALSSGSIESRAQVASARATKQAADIEAARQARLFGSGISARRELDDAQTRATAATAELQAAEAREALASQRLARRELRAPHAGVVLHVWRRAGETVDGTAAMPIAELADLTVLEVRAQVAPRSLIRLRDGQAARIRVLGLDAAIAGTVLRVAPAVDPQTLLGTVRLRLAADTPRPPIGSAAAAEVVVAQRTGLVVPIAALRRSPAGADELVICQAGVARTRSVAIGQRTAASAEIVSGLAAGEQVVVDHVLGLEDGQRLVQPKARP
jgi:HlyD family secretion protein